MKTLLTLLTLALLPALPALAAENQFHGLVDLRYSVTDGLPGYQDGNYGKFLHGDGRDLSLGQAALTWRSEFTDSLGLYVIGNHYAGDAGLSEAYLHYRGLPGTGGLRLEARAGLLYPRVSMENPLTAWASPYTLDYSTLNGWIGEEVRHQGMEFHLTRLGKFHGSEHDLGIGLSLLRGNDPTGAMLAWHGWVSTSRQSLWGERLPLPNPRQVGFIPAASDPFVELDGRIGYHATFDWDWHGRGKLLAGYYDNNADPKVVEDLQWAWTTRFAHLGIRWSLPGQVDLLAQILSGDTLMQSGRSGADLVNNTYHSAFVLLSKETGPHRLTLRLEDFGVRDHDQIPADDNNEDGNAATFSYAYRLGRHWFVQTEYTWMDSERPARRAADQPAAVVERQWQVALRYFF